ncbi:hypothetical protein MMPV_003052 [Pyropia vietnamensis]
MFSVRRGLLPLRRLLSTTPSPCAGVASASPPVAAPPFPSSSPGSPSDTRPDEPVATSCGSGGDGMATPPSRPPRKHCRPKNLFEVAAYLPNDGLAGTFLRNAWNRAGYTDCYWTITRVEPHRKAGNYPKYYGILTWKGVPGKETRVKPAFKRGWRFVREPQEGGGREAVGGGGGGKGGAEGGAPGVLRRADARREIEGGADASPPVPSRS